MAGWKSKARLYFSGLVVMVVLTAVVACQSPGQNTTATEVRPVPDWLDSSRQSDVQRASEVQLVEEMAQSRNQYRKKLEELIKFYDQQGNHLKASWASQELDHLQHGPHRPYLVVAEIAGPDLKASESIAPADKLYEEAMDLYKQGRGKLGRFFVDKKKLYQARDKFNEIITNYPTSDKIDDAAYYIADIDNYYLEDYHAALLYYQRVWQWDPQTPLPARFAVAKIYDYKLNDKLKALKYYQEAINLESTHYENVTEALDRIKVITQEISSKQP